MNDDLEANDFTSLGFEALEGELYLRLIGVSRKPVGESITLLFFELEIFSFYFSAEFFAIILPYSVSSIISNKY